MSQGRLPLFSVLFVDWHGVLSHEPFWASVLRGADVRLRRSLEERLTQVFAGELAATWMRGETSVEQIVEPLAHALGCRRRDFLQRRLIEDCLRMEVDRQLAALLTELARTAYVVLATDNTADFEHAFRRAHASRSPFARRPAQPEPTPASLRELAPILDDIICSSARGTFKAEDPNGFFGAWLESSGMGFADAVLVDDREDNCLAFEAAGGRAVRWGVPDGPDVLRRLCGPPVRRAPRPAAA